MFPSSSKDTRLFAMSWCRTLFVLSLVCATTHSKALTSNDSVRKSRQLDFGECCPCPKPRGDLSEEPLYPVEPIVDDCPCRNKATDSEGASSILSPALQALRPLIRSEDPKTEPEPLLKPEVGLASSVLKTLQEVTNEEYEDALARDATRSVVKAIETDLPLLQSEDAPGSIINIILNPKETGNDLEVVPEASHLQETRCIHPLGSTHNNYERNNFKYSLFKDPNKNQVTRGSKSNVRSNDFDMDNQASEIQNSLQRPSNEYVMKSLYEPEEITNSQETYIDNPNTAHDKTFDEQSAISASNGFSKVPDFKLSTIVDNIKKSIQSNSLLNKLTKKEMKTPVSEHGTNTPITTVTEEKPRKLTGTLKNLQNVINYVEKPTNLKNLLKLKDVELIPKRKIVSDQKMKQKSVTNDDSIINASISDDEKIGGQQANTQTEILDAVSSSSNRVESESTNDVLLKPQILENNACNEINVIPSEESTKTNQKILNNMNESELEKYEIVDEVNNPSMEKNLVQNESDKQVIESEKKYGITKQKSENSSEHEISTSKDEPTFKENQSVEEMQGKNILPLIKADIIKSFKNFKKVNDNMQEKLRQNLQDVLQVVDTDKKKIIENENSKPIKNLNNSKNITEDDLQRMSDSILNESNMKIKKLKPSFKQTNVENELDNCVPTGDNNQNFVEENAINKSSSEESVTQSNTSNLNNPPNEEHSEYKGVNKSGMPLESLTDRLSDNSINKNNLNEIGRNGNQLEQNNKESISKIPDVNSNIDNSDEKTLDKHCKDFTDSSVEAPKSSNSPQITNIVDLCPIDTDIENSATQEENKNNDLKTEMSQINEETSNLSKNRPSESISNEERKCLESNSNDMNVQASEPIGNRVTFDRPDFSILKSDRPLTPNFSIGSALKPYSARLASPHSLDRATIHPYLSGKMNSLQGTFKNNNLKNVFKNLEIGELPTLGNNKRNDISISKPLDEFNLISDNFKSRTDESLKNLNNILGSSPDELKSNHLYKNVLNNADDIRHSLSRAHNDLNNKLQQLHSDWTDKIHTISQRTDTPLPLKRVANDRSNIFNTEKKIPLINFEKPRTESNIMRGKPKTLLNDEKFKLLQLSLPKSLYKAPSLSERKATILSTTKRPLPMFTTKRPPRKEVSLKSVPKPTLSQTLKDVIESAKSDKLNSKMRDMKTLSSNIKPLRVPNQDYSARKSIPETRESSENQENVQPFKDITTESSRRGGFRRNSGLPFQLKAEEFSVLKKLLDGIRSSQLESDMLRNNDDYDENANENLQAPSQNIERFKMPENTLKENVSYKCKMTSSCPEKL